MKELIISERKLKIERTTEHTDIVLSATPYVVKGLKGIEFKLKALPYSLRVLTKDSPAIYQQSTVKFTGIMREYNGQQYFTPKDITIVEMSNLAKLAVSGVPWAGAI